MTRIPGSWTLSPKYQSVLASTLMELAEYTQVDVTATSLVYRLAFLKVLALCSLVFAFWTGIGLEPSQ